MEKLVCVLLSIFFPPLGVLIKEGFSNHLVFNIILTFLGWIPGVIHALYIVLREEEVK